MFGVSVLISRLWSSPTFATWGNYSAQSLRFVLITPLILTRFTEVEIAAWYLFTTINFIGSTISQRFGATFSRMISFAMGGATDLSAIKKTDIRTLTEGPNWSMVGRIYGTLGWLNLRFSIVFTVIALFLGWYSLSKLLGDYENQNSIWIGFSIIQVSTLLCYIFQRFRITLQGMDYVALVNRWEMVFSIISVIAGCVTLIFNGGFIALVIIMQSIVAIGIIRNWYLLNNLSNHDRVIQGNCNLDRHVLKWATEPTIKGIIIALSGFGIIQFSGIFVVANLPLSVATSYLLTLRVVSLVEQFSYAPLVSIGPRLSRFLSASEFTKFEKLWDARSNIVMILCVIMFSGIFLFLPVILLYINSKVILISSSALLLLMTMRIIQRGTNTVIYMLESGNYVISTRIRIVAAIISMIALYGYNYMTIIPVICVVNAPFILIGIWPVMKAGGKFININASALLIKRVIFPTVAFEAIVILQFI